MKIEIYKTQRGFKRGDFDDTYGSKCSIQESSLATEACIWLGVHEGSPEYESQESSRMHLNTEMAAALIPLLKKFVKTGGL